MEKLHDKTFPNESSKYREARNKLLQSEIELRSQVEKVAEERRSLPTGGMVKENYIFEEMDDWGNIKETKLSELFEPGKDSLIIYSAMFSPNAKSPCPGCTAYIDGINGMIFHAEQNINYAVIAKAPIQKIEKWARTRNWKNVRFLSSEKNSFNMDYHAEDEKGAQWPAQNVFVKKPDGIYHFHNAEMLYSKPFEGQDARHIELVEVLWNLFDYTPEGRPKKWDPKLKYDK